MNYSYILITVVILLAMMAMLTWLNLDLHDQLESVELQCDGLLRDFYEVRSTLHRANEIECGPINDTIWMNAGAVSDQTLFDFMDEVIENTKVAL